MSQNIIQIQPRTCFRCRYEAALEHTNCPSCGGKMKTRGQIRVLGFIMTLLCGFIIIFMGGIAWNLSGLANQTGKAGTAARFTGSKNDLMMIFALFGGVILFGCVGLITGLWQLIFGRRNIILSYTAIGLGAALYIGSLGYWFYF